MGNVKCYADETCERVIGMVDYTDNLDHWDGHNWTSGGTGYHIGIGKTKLGKWYVCYGTQWEGQQDYAHIISEAAARQKCLDHGGNYEQLFGEPPADI